MLKHLLRTTCLTPVLLLTAGAMAGELPAVSQPNSVVSIGVASDDDGLWLSGDARLAAALGDLLGAQGDVQFEVGDGYAHLGVASHLFLRDPTLGLIGLYGAGSLEDDGTVLGKLGVEAELYLGALTASALVTSDQDGDVDAKARIALYPAESTKLYFGIDNIEVTELTAGFEQSLGSNVSLFAETSYDSNDESFAVLGGIRIQFAGEERSLIQRDREDVAPLWRIIDNPTVDASASPSSSASPSASPSPSPSFFPSPSPSFIP
jgi:hypothetical protein